MGATCLGEVADLKRSQTSSCARPPTSGVIAIRRKKTLISNGNRPDRGLTKRDNGPLYHARACICKREIAERRLDLPPIRLCNVRG